MSQEQKYQIIIFPEDINKTIADLFEKHGVRETRKDAVERFKNGKYPKAVSLAKICRDYFEKKITDDGFVDSLKENLEISENVAKKIFPEAREKIVKKITIEIREKTDENKPEPTVEQKSKVEELPKNQLKKSLPETSIAPKEDKSLPKKPVDSSEPKPTNSDRYREPIA
jgi:hypothetical protein